MTQKIPLTKGLMATVCDCHAHLVSHRKWFASPTKSGHVYALSRNTKEEKLSGAPEHTLMHRLIANTPRGYDTDHISGDTLDNRCCNLRIATRSQNMRNNGKHANNTSGYKGVYFNDRGNRKSKWVAATTINGKPKKLGRYKTAEEAAHAYDAFVKQNFGEFALTNF